jgi:preprotein translocase subunit SecG
MHNNEQNSGFLDKMHAISKHFWRVCFLLFAYLEKYKTYGKSEENPQESRSGTSKSRKVRDVLRYLHSYA